MPLTKMKHDDGRTALVEDFQKADFEAEGFSEANPKTAESSAKAPVKDKK